MVKVAAIKAKREELKKLQDALILWLKNNRIPTPTPEMKPVVTISPTGGLIKRPTITPIKQPIYLDQKPTTEVEGRN